MIAAILVAILLLFGAGVRRWVGWIERARIPASVVAGAIGCLVAQLLLASTDRWDASLQSILATFRSSAGTLISIVFAGLLLAPSNQTLQRSRDIWQQGICAWIIILGQLALGLIATALLIRPFYDVPGPFGQYIEVTMAGGFGSAASMASVLESDAYRFAPARDLLVFGATAGLVWGVLSGLFLARLGQKRGWTVKQDENGKDEPRGTGYQPVKTDSIPDGPAVLEPILLQGCFLAIALGLGLLMQWLVSLLAIRLDLLFESARFQRHLGDLPLFFFALLGGWLLRIALRLCRQADLLDREMIHRLCGIAMDFLIVTSLASIAFRQIQAYLWPVVLLLAIGSIWSLFCLLWLSPRLLPRRYWFELGLINYGFSTAATAQGMMFLKLVDPRLRSGAAETYALGAPLTAPFIGGGVITFAVLPPMIGWIGAAAVAGMAGIIMIALFVVGRTLSSREMTTSSPTGRGPG